MFALIRMDWTLNRRILFHLSPVLVLWILAGMSRGMESLFALSFTTSALLMGLTLFQNLRDTVEPFVCALPVSRRQIVLARYLSALGAMALSLGIWFLLGWTGHRLGFHWAAGIQAGDLAAGLGLHALSLGAGLFLYLPFHFRFGGDLGLGIFTATLMACLVTLFLICGWQGLLNRVLHLLSRILENRTFAAGVITVWGLLGTASLALSVWAYGTRNARSPAPASFPVLLILMAFLVLGL